MAAFVRLSDTALEREAEAFFAEPTDLPLSLLWSPGQDVPLRSYAGREAPELPQRRHVFEAGSYAADPIRLYRLLNARFLGVPAFIADEHGRIVRESLSGLGRFTVDTAADALAAAGARFRKRGGTAVTEENLAADLPVLPGRYLFATGGNTRNYYHWHLDSLPVVTAAKRLGVLDDYKAAVIWPTQFNLDSLACLGVGEQQIVNLQPGAAVRFEEVIFCSTLRIAGMRVNPAAGETFAEIIAALPQAAVSDGGRRLFVSRGASERRLLVNRSSVEAAFAAAGFEVIDPGAMSYREQAACFRAAEVVVGEHGGGLGNIGFCQPQTLVIELFNPLHHDLCYLGLAEIRGLRHRICVGEVEPGAGPRREWRIDAGAAVRFVIDAIGRGPAAPEG